MSKVKECISGTKMVLNRINTQNSIKNLYNMNTKTKKNVAEILRLHISFGEFEQNYFCIYYSEWQVFILNICHFLYYIQMDIIGAFFVANNIINIIFIKMIQTIDNVIRN